MTLRCAIYARKSTEEGLEQDFNSLHAQREACQAYIASQRHEGWRVIVERFEDGGYSGGNMERPALTRLFDRIKAGSVDVIVVYKVDRLTRSLHDFARMVELFDKHKVSFVSVTQQFNTTTSMGRLTLNVLLSFAQFEREVTAERIRDKIAASKKKGMWMGGPPPLGYDIHDRKLVINGKEAETAREIFRLYLKLGVVRLVKAEIDRRGIVTKVRIGPTGKRMGGRPISRGNLHEMLRNPLYVGEVPHRGATYPGQHDAIIDRKTWTAVQQHLDQNGHERRSATNVSSANWLTGLLFDEDGTRLSPTFTVKNGMRYRYYVSEKRGNWRLPAREIESLVLKAVDGFLRDPKRLLVTFGPTLPPSEMRSLMEEAKRLAAHLSNQTIDANRTLQAVLARVVLARASVAVELKDLGLWTAFSVDSGFAPSDKVHRIDVPIVLQRRGVESRLVLAENQRDARPDPRLIRLVAQAYCWAQELLTGESENIEAIAKREGLDAAEVTRVLPCGFLAPQVVQSVLDGRSQSDLTVEKLKRHQKLPLAWSKQT